MTKTINTILVLAILLLAPAKASADGADPWKYVRETFVTLQNQFNALKEQVQGLTKKVDEKKTMWIVDTTGEKIGWVISHGLQMNYVVFSSEHQIFFNIDPSFTSIIPNQSDITFAEVNCTGQAYTGGTDDRYALRGVSKKSGIFYLPDKKAVPVPTIRKSVLSVLDNGCYNKLIDSTVIPAYPVELYYEGPFDIMEE